MNWYKSSAKKKIPALFSLKSAGIKKTYVDNVGMLQSSTI